MRAMKLLPDRDIRGTSDAVEANHYFHDQDVNVQKTAWVSETMPPRLLEPEECLPWT